MLYSVFTIISIPLLVPFFTILFDRTTPQPIRPTGSNLNEWIKFIISDLIEKNGKETTLLYVCLILIVVFFKSVV